MAFKTKKKFAVPVAHSSAEKGQSYQFQNKSLKVIGLSKSQYYVFKFDSVSHSAFLVVVKKWLIASNKSSG